MREVLKALQFLHKRSIAHLDLKPQNILLTGERIEDGLKLCDFGISRVVAEGTNVREIVGTPDYVAPEVLQYEPLSLLTDIWSVGVLAYVLLSGFSPFGGETKQETFLNISQCALTFPDKLFGGVSAAAIDFMRRALRIKPNDRMTAAGCLEHIWLKDECSIDRQIRTDITKPTTIDDDADEEDEEEQLEDDAEVDGEEELDDNKLEAENENLMSHDDDADVNGDELNMSTEDERLNATTTNDSKMESSDAEEIAEDEKVKPSKPMQLSNRKGAHNNSNESSSTNGYYNGRSASNRYSSNNNAGYAAGTIYTNCTKSTANGKSTATTTQRTTAIVTVPAMRATTIPLQYKGGHYQQQHQKQQLQHLQIPARRHSSSHSNKENTFLATKKIMPTAALIKKPLIATTTTTIIIGGNEMMDSAAVASTTSTSVVATFTLPSNGYNHHGHNASTNNNSSIQNGTVNGSESNSHINNEKYATATHCLFPDAPTTPKVIRKAPNAEGSPTSVKALVKKFQLEGNNSTSPNGTEKHATTTTHLKEAQSTNQQTHSMGPTSPQINCGIHGHGGSSKKSTPMSNGICKKYGGSDQSNNGNHYITSNGRRASEPTTIATHVTVAHNRSGSGGDVGSNYKSTCVFCISCGSKAASSSTNTNGCRHSMDNTTAGKVSKGSSNSNKSNNTAKATANTTANGSNSTTSNSSTALSLYSPQKQQQQQQQPHINGVHPHAHTHHHHKHHHAHAHHHHMHAVTAATKNVTANNLSLDQGIIC
ncbi:death-associated protein kinase related isoform X2 [Eurosta solidaginis]